MPVEPVDTGADSADEAVASSPFAEQPDSPDVEETAVAPDEPERVLDESAVSDVEPEEDLSWVESIKSYKELHGLALADLVKALAEGKIPEALWDKIKLPLKDGDYEWEDTIADMRNGTMMRRNYTKKLQQLADDRRQYETERDGFLTYFDGWRGDASGVTLLDALERLGMPFDAAARVYAQRLHDYDQMSPTEKKLYDEKRALEKRMREFEEQNQTQTSKQQEAQEEAEKNKIRQFVQGAASKVFAELKLPLNEGNWNLFAKHLVPLWNEHGTPDANMIRYAAQAAKEESESYISAYAQRTGQPIVPPSASAPVPAPPKKPAALGQRPLDGGAPKQMNPAAAPKRSTPKDFYKRMMGR